MANRYRYIDEGRQHLHSLDGKPLIGASTAVRIIGTGDTLMQWYADLAAVAGLAKPQQDIKEAYETANAIQDRDLRRQAKAALDNTYPDYADARKAPIYNRDGAAKKGTTRHGVLEDYIKLCIEKKDGKPLPEKIDEIQMFIDWAVANVAKFYFTEANCYHESMWVGGIADIGLQLKNGKNIIGDHKSGREAYSKQFLQTALYDLLLAHSGILDAEGNKIGEWKPADGMVVFPFRSEPFTPEFKWDMDRWHTAAKSAVEIYKLIELT